ncbi:bone morphogenetic protein 2-like [Orussus abietinus]|uniref:bone morphogenetic protein 2-like n=1 Tax=Orussus abietinus TaxID=222816 RepID=UPI00062635E7|nr:bone morphogenetic protein 2-like [Orussus abietinus]
MKTSLWNWFLLFTSSLFVFSLWRSGILTWSTSTVLAKASIEVDLSLPSAPIPSQRVFNKTSKKYRPRRKHHHAGSKYMLRLYRHRQGENYDIVRALEPVHVSCPIFEGQGRILEFSIPNSKPGEFLQTAELLGTAGTIFRVSSMDEVAKKRVQRSRRDDHWRAFDVTWAVATRNGDLVRLLVLGKVRARRQDGEGPILLLGYSKPGKRAPRSVPEEDQEEVGVVSWEEEHGRRRRRNACRRRPLYVDFAMIAYDDWVVAPPGYEAYQCSGKCFYPFGDHLSPTKHAIVQTLVHGALQGGNPGTSGRPVGRACCVPTRLAPTSLLYLDASGTLTYQYGYEDMVVAECGCR